MSSWFDKDDLDLTAEDIDGMLDAGLPVEATGPPLPGGAVFVAPLASYGGHVVPIVASSWSPAVMTSVSAA